MGSISPTQHHLKCGESYLIRSARTDDASALLAHGRGVISEGKFLLIDLDEFTLTEEQEQNWIRQYVDDPGKLLIVAEVSGCMAGVLFFESGPHKRLAHRGTLHMSVNRKWRSQGIGTALLQTLFEWAKTHPTVEKLSLCVFATNTTAIELYRKLGFIEEGRQPREIKAGPEEYEDQILMYRFV